MNIQIIWGLAGNQETKTQPSTTTHKKDKTNKQKNYVVILGLRFPSESSSLLTSTCVTVRGLVRLASLGASVLWSSNELKQAEHMRTFLLQPLLCARCGEHSLHTGAPHLRQWCTRCTAEKSRSHRWQFLLRSHLSQIFTRQSSHTRTGW